MSELAAPATRRADEERQDRAPPPAPTLIHHCNLPRVRCSRRWSRPIQMGRSFTVNIRARCAVKRCRPAGLTRLPQTGHRDFWRGYCRAALRRSWAHGSRGSESGSAPAVAFVAAARRIPPVADLVAQRSASPSTRVPGRRAAAAVHCAGVRIHRRPVFALGLRALSAPGGWPIAALAITGTICGHAGHSGDAIKLLRYRWLRSGAAGAAARKRAPAATTGSVARLAMSALGASERGFFSLLRQRSGAPCCRRMRSRPNGRGQPDFGGDGGDRGRGGLDGAPCNARWRRGRICAGTITRATAQLAPASVIQRNGHRCSAFGFLGAVGLA